MDTTNKRIVKNTFFLYFRMLFIMAVQLYTSRVVLRVLGAEDYGIYNIVGGVVVLFSFINGSLSSATQRFLNFELGRGDMEKLKRVFSMSLTIHICVAFAVVIIAETIGLWFLNTKMNIPSERTSAANFVYQFSILTVCMSFVQVPYHASVIAYEKMSFFAYIAIAETCLKLLMVFLLVYIGLDKLCLYSVLNFCVAVIIFLCYKRYCNRKFEISRYRYFWDKGMFSRLLDFSGWMLFGSAAMVGATQGVNILLNVFHGVVVNAAMGIGNQVNAAVNLFVSNFQTAFMPQVVKLYATGDIPQLRVLINRASRFSFLLLFALACPLMLNIDFVLHLWLEEVPPHTAVFCVLILIYSLIESISKPVGLIIHATGRVKLYNIVMSIALSMNIVFSFIFLQLGFPPEIVSIVSILVCIVCLAIRLSLVSYYHILKIRDYICSVLLRSLGVVCLALPLPLYISTFYSHWNAFFSTSLVFILLLVCIVYFVGLTKAERNKVSIIIKRRIFRGKRKQYDRM